MRTILHLDLDAFFCAVEEIDNPALQGKPFAVGGRPEDRGVVASCSYAARALGIHSAMPMKLAIRQCPELILVEPHRQRYEELSHQVMDRLHALAPLVEQISIDEAFVDLGDIFSADAENIAQRLQQRIWDELHLPCSIGIAANKLVAKIATETGKKSARGPSYPRAICVVPAGQEAEFLAPLPTPMLWGVGPKTEASLAELGIHTIGELAHWPTTDLVQRFGKNGDELSRHARGIDDRPVVTEHEVKSISQEITFSQDVSDDKRLEETLKSMSAQVGHTLRSEKLVGKTVKLKLRWPNFTTLTRQVTLPAPTDQDDDIYKAALGLLRQVRHPGKAVRLIGVGMSGLGEPVYQMDLWGQPHEKQRKVQVALDELQEKFGKKVIDKGKLR
jgi:DNA polymerase-4